MNRGQHGGGNEQDEQGQEAAQGARADVQGAGHEGRQEEDGEGLRFSTFQALKPGDPVVVRYLDSDREQRGVVVGPGPYEGMLVRLTTQGGITYEANCHPSIVKPEPSRRYEVAW